MNVSLEKVDNFCNYVPLVSTVTNLINLFQKAVIWCCYSSAPKNHYYTHLDHKSVFTCIQLMIPVLGNISVALTKHYQSIQAQSKEGLLKLIGSDPYYFYTYGSDKLKEDFEFVSKAIYVSSFEVLKWCSPNLLSNKKFVLHALKKNLIEILDYVDKDLRYDPDIFVATVSKNPESLNSLPENVINKEGFIDALMTAINAKGADKDSFFFALERCKDNFILKNKDFVLKFIKNSSKQEFSNLQSIISSNFPAEVSVFEAAFNKYGSVSCLDKYYTEEWAKNNDIIKAAFRLKPFDTLLLLKLDKTKITDEMVEIAIDNTPDFATKRAMLSLLKEHRLLDVDTFLNNKGVEKFKNAFEQDPFGALASLNKNNLINSAMVKCAVTSCINLVSADNAEIAEANITLVTDDILNIDGFIDTFITQLKASSDKKVQFLENLYNYIDSGEHITFTSEKESTTLCMLTNSKFTLKFLQEFEGSEIEPFMPKMYTDFSQDKKVIAALDKKGKEIAASIRKT